MFHTYIKLLLLVLLLTLNANFLNAQGAIPCSSMVNPSRNGTRTKVTDSLSVYQSETKGASFSGRFKGGRIGFYALAGPKCGYARVIVTDKKGGRRIKSVSKLRL